MAQTLGRVSIASVGAIFVYTLAHETSLRSVATTALPTSCVDTYEWLTTSPSRP
jgi:hypothetical protein